MIRNPDVSQFPKWQRVLPELTALVPGRVFPRNQELLQHVHEDINKMKYLPDSCNWGKHDYWATPKEIASKQAGDCEDYCIAKLARLLTLGWDDSSTELVVCKCLTGRYEGELHAVLMASTENGEWYILDNQHENLISITRMDTFYECYYGINRKGWRDLRKILYNY